MRQLVTGIHSPIVVAFDDLSLSIERPNLLEALDYIVGALMNAVQRIGDGYRSEVERTDVRLELRRVAVDDCRSLVDELARATRTRRVCVLRRPGRPR